MTTIAEKIDRFDNEFAAIAQVRSMVQECCWSLEDPVDLDRPDDLTLFDSRNKSRVEQLGREIEEMLEEYMAALHIAVDAAPIDTNPNP